ncbi:MAG: LysR family transcriptional regulator [Oceanospirillaceae bacterium]
MRIELRHIKYFTALAEQLHFRRTAEHLNVAQPALSRTIQHLESEIGVLLFERTNRSVKLTEAGQVFLEGCKGLINSMEAAIENTRRVSYGELGTLRIGYTDFAIAGVLPQLLKDFRLAHSGIVLQPSHGVTTNQLEMLAASQLDIGFITGKVQHSGFDSCPVQSESFICLVYETHPLANRKSIKLAELAGEDFILGPIKDWRYYYDYLIPLCREAGFTPNVVQEAFNSAGILGLVACGMGVTILTESIYNHGSKGIVSLKIEGIKDQLVTSAIWQPAGSTGPKNTFIKYIEENFRL